MYSIYDYIYNGIVFVNNVVRRQHKELTSLMIYSTTNCQSRCKHCSIWKKPIENLSLDDIINIMNSKCVTKRTMVGLEGGEFILHPEADKILGWFDTNHPNYTLLSNCLAADKVISSVKNHHPKHLYISLDGNRETYRYMRGRDGYDKVIKVIETCKDIVPISLMFCLSPWNSFEDMRHVIDCAKQYNIDVRIGIYSTMSFFDTTKDLMESNDADFISQIPSSIHQTYENFDPLCQNLDVILGNIHENTLDEIFNSRNTCKIQCQHSKECNQCWINYHRKYDIILLRNLEKMFPKRLIELFYGKYQWTSDRQTTYKKHFKQIKA